MSLPPRLGATYRVQLRDGWGFDAAAGTVPYLERLGIETIYLSPIAEAVPGSTHGYDGTDPTRLREELGGDAGYGRLVAACEAHGLGICVDIVPNHLATWPRGPWWRRLLAEGRDSEIADVFDVDWDAARRDRLRGDRPQVALPLLDRPLPDALAAGLVRLGRRDGEDVVALGADGSIDLPVATGPVRPGDDVAEVLTAQHYRLGDWHDPAARNYRRFFDIDGLVGVRVEVPDVFERTHALVADLARRGRLSAVRVDHVDGLRDPGEYLRRLVDATGVPVVVEKILTGDEQLQPAWPVAGTTGYEVMDDVAGVLVDPEGLADLVAAGRGEGDEPVGPLTVQTRRLVATASFPVELDRAAGSLDVPVESLTEVVVRLGRYRTYLPPLPAAGDEGAEGSEAAVWLAAEEAAEADAGGPLSAGADAGGAVGSGAPTAISHTGGAVAGAVVDPGNRAGALDLQQLTGAVMAKGVEDTAWYRLAGPLAFCEVGGDPGRDRADAVARFHERAANRVARGFAGLVPGTTHDTKRSEDVRARLYALTELAPEFEKGLAAVRTELGLPDGGGDLAFESRVATQLGLAVLPPMAAAAHPWEQGGAPLGDAGWQEEGSLARRLGAALEKGAREAKLRSSWREPDEEYERALQAMAAALVEGRGALLRRCFGPLVPELARRGALKSLSALVLRHASPGTPDTYQGDETWNLSLVDPDNRRPVDHGALAGALAGLPDPRGAAAGDVADLRRAWPDGRIKLFVATACLRARRGPAAAALAAGSEVVALEAGGPAAGALVAFGRVAAISPQEWALAVVTSRSDALPTARTPTAQAPRPLDSDQGKGGPADLPFGPSYAGTELALPAGAPPRYRDALTGTVVEARDGRLAVDEALALLPVALLVADGTGPVA